MNDISSRIITCRKDSGLSQTEFAKLLGIGQSTVWNWEHGKAFPGPKNIKLAAEAFQVFESWLKTGEGPRNKTEEEQLQQEARERRHQREREEYALKKAKEDEPPKETPKKYSTTLLQGKPTVSKDERALDIICRAIASIPSSGYPDEKKVYRILSKVRGYIEASAYFTDSSLPEDDVQLADMIRAINDAICYIVFLKLEKADKEELYLYLNDKRADAEMSFIFD